MKGHRAIMAIRVSGKRWSAETEVRKQKYEVRRKATYQCLVPYWLTNVCWGLVDKRGLNLCNVKAGSSTLWLQWVSCRYRNVHVTARPKPRQTTVSAWANHVGSMLLECLDSDTDASVVVVLLQWLNQLQNYSRDTSKYSPLHRGVVSERDQDKTTHTVSC